MYGGTGRGLFITNCVERNQTVNEELYVQQMERLKMAIQEKRPNQQHNVLLMHGNARPHVANMTKEAIQTHGWEVLPHPPYSPDLAPTDFHLFRSLSNAMRGVSFYSDAELRACLDEFFESKSNNSYRKSIENLVERWEKVVGTNGEYIID